MSDKKKVEEAKAKLHRIREKYEAISGRKFPEASATARGGQTCFSLINGAAHMALLAIQAEAAGDDPGPYIEMSNMMSTAATAQGC